MGDEPLAVSRIYQHKEDASRLLVEYSNDRIAVFDYGMVDSSPDAESPAKWRLIHEAGE